MSGQETDDELSNLQQELDPKKLTAYYAIALLIIASLSVVSHVLLNFMVKQNDGYAELINVSGRQRMLSQRIAGMSERYAGGEVVIKDQLRDAINLFESSHAYLKQSKDVQSGTSTNAERLRDIYFEGYQPLDDQVSQYIEVAREVLKDGSRSKLTDEAVKYLQEEADLELLLTLDRVVQTFQAESERKLENLRLFQKGILLIVLLTLLCEALLLFRPMIKKIVHVSSMLVLQVSMDPISKLHNRKSFLTSINAAVKEFRMRERTSFLLIFEIGNYDLLHEKHGYKVTDALADRVGECVQKQLQKQDIGGRISEHGFGILLTASSLERTALCATRLLESIQGILLTIGKTDVPIDVSMGVSEVNTNIEVTEALAQANRALAKAKLSKDNPVMIFYKDRVQNINDL